MQISNNLLKSSVSLSEKLHNFTQYFNNIQFIENTSQQSGPLDEERRIPYYDLHPKC